MASDDRRWQQRFANYRRAVARLQEAVLLSQQRSLTDLERQGLIQAFEFTHELSWKTLKDFFTERGIRDLYGSRDTTREAFSKGLILDGERWMQMIRHRNLSTHTYDDNTISEIVDAVIHFYLAAFVELEATLLKKQESA
jgi:nucleotidyltransferase substrate binding protein (TIGR01987 family)